MRRALLPIAVLILLTAAGCPGTFMGKRLPGIKLVGPATDEEQIAAILNDVREGMETHRVYKIFAHVSENYADQEGRNYAQIRDYIQGVLKTYRSIRVTRARPRILVEGDRARALEAFGTIAEPYDADKGLPINLQGQVAVYLERTGGVWKIVEWGRLQ